MKLKLLIDSGRFMVEEDKMIYLQILDLDYENVALLVMLTIVLVGLTFAITAHLLFKMQN